MAIIPQQPEIDVSLFPREMDKRMDAAFIGSFSLGAAIGFHPSTDSNSQMVAGEFMPSCSFTYTSAQSNGSADAGEL